MLDKLKNFKSMYWTPNMAKVRKFVEEKYKVEDKKEEIENE